MINKLIGNIMASPIIKNPVELKGKVIGVTSPSGGGWMFTTLALEYWGLELLYDKRIYRRVDGIRNVIRLLGATNEKIRRFKAEDLVDERFMVKLEKEGRF